MSPVSPRPSSWYRAAVATAALGGWVGARFNPKLARGLEGRRGLAARMAAWGEGKRDTRRPLVWLHAPSVGEGLQVQPVIDALRAAHPDWQLVYTFFSPSAERLARGLPVDFTDYLPLDRPRAVAAALQALAPTALVFGKLDVWPELTLAAARHGAGVAHHREAFSVQGLDGRRTARSPRGADFRDRRSGELAPGLAGPPMGDAGLCGARPDRRDRGNGCGAARAPGSECRVDHRHR